MQHDTKDTGHSNRFRASGLSELLARPIAYDDESPGGFLLRVTQENCWESAGRTVTHVLGDEFSSVGSYISLLTRPESLERLTGALGLSPGTGARIAYHRDGLTESTPIIWESVRTEWRSLRLRTQALCPACLGEKNYGRRIWDHRLITACLRHSTLLLDRCPSCGHRLCWNRKGVGICRCGHDVSQTPCESVDVSGLRFLNEILASRNQSAFDAVEGLFDALSDMIGKPATMAETHALVALSCLGVQEAEKLAARLISRFCDMSDSGVRIHPRLRFVSLLASPHAPVQAVGLAALQLSVEGTDREGVGGVSRWSDGEEIDIGAIGMKEAGVALGVPGKLVSQLIESRLLKGERTSAKGPWLIHACDVNRILQAMEPRSPARDVRAETGFMNLKAYLNQPGRRRNFSQAVGEVLSGAVESAGFDIETGLLTLRLRLASCPSPQVLSDGLAIPELARLCDVHSENIRFAINVGLIEASVRAVSGRTQYIVPAEEAERFHRECVFAAALAREAGVSVRGFAEKLQSVDIKPISGPGIDKGLAFVFRRQDVESKDLAQIAAIRNYPTKSGRKKAGEMTTKQVGIALVEAAKMIGISPLVVASLVKKGVLEQEVTSTRGLYVTEASITRLQERLSDPELIVVSEAADALGETKIGFEKRWVQSKMVEVMDLGVRRVIRCADLEKVKEFKRSYMTAQEAGDALGSHRSMLPNLERRGLIAPDVQLPSGGKPIKFYRRAEVMALPEKIKGGQDRPVELG